MTDARAGSRSALVLPGAVAAGFVALGLAVQRPAGLHWALLGAGVGLAAWIAALWATARSASRSLVLQVVVRRHHWVQACAQTAIVLYWGWHVRLVYAYLPLILVQFAFAYAVEGLLTWSRRDTWQLGFGPLPIIFSINLFLWFKPEWFYWQLAMIVVGYAAKELIRWQRDGRSAHIFNPSSFPLGVFSVALILTGSSGITFGSEIASTQLYPSHIYLVIFLASLPGQILFGVARMTLSAVVTAYLVSVLYFAGTGTYLYYDTHIPIAIFLGMHLLFTDPSTSPRTEQGRILFGVVYALGTTAFYVLLGKAGIPTFYDKLLPVPLMNLTVRGIDRLVASGALRALDPARLGAALTPIRRNLAYTSLWAVAFVAMSAARGLGDRQPGQSLHFWRQTCSEGSPRACAYALSMTAIYCDDGSGWACNEWGVEQLRAGRRADGAFRRACDLGFAPACTNVGRTAADAAAATRADPVLADLPIVLRGSKPPLRGRDAAELYAIACDQGWRGTCVGDAGA